MRRGLLGVLASVALYGQATPARLEFEVASIKPASPDEFNQVGAGVHIDSSQVSYNFYSLNDLIRVAYRVYTYQISGPDWTRSERFDVVAKLPVGAARREIPGMLRNLLEDRFRLRSHRESRDFQVYALVVAKGGLKMQQSPPDSAPQVQSDVRPGFSAAAVSRPGGTMDYGDGAYFKFADSKAEGHKMPAGRIASQLTPYLDRPVIDTTNVKGNYDFVLELSPEDFRAMGIRSAIAAGVALPPQAIQMAEAASGDSLSNALEKLGLKLESRKAPVEVLVIDHAEKAPSEN
jgi:uncharacterized protein (TIGR03435 family)